MSMNSAERFAFAWRTRPWAKAVPIQPPPPRPPPPLPPPPCSAHLTLRSQLDLPPAKYRKKEKKEKGEEEEEKGGQQPPEKKEKGGQQPPPEERRTRGASNAQGDQSLLPKAIWHCLQVPAQGYDKRYVDGSKEDKGAQGRGCKKRSMRSSGPWPPTCAACLQV